MPLPPKVRVKLSSEAAEAISITPVVVQELAIRDLMDHILGVTGKDEARIGELLLRGTLVSGASRFRWQGWEADREEVRALLATFPDPDPSRRFLAANCERAILRGGRQTIPVVREAVGRKGLFQRESFWDTLMRIAQVNESRALRPIRAGTGARRNGSGSRSGEVGEVQYSARSDSRGRVH